MKKIIIIDGGPRKNFNTASMLQQFAEGATSVGKEIEVKTVRLVQGCTDTRVGGNCAGRRPCVGVAQLFQRDNGTDAGIPGTDRLPVALVQRLQHKKISKQ